MGGVPLVVVVGGDAVRSPRSEMVMLTLLESWALVNDLLGSSIDWTKRNKTAFAEMGIMNHAWYIRPTSRMDPCQEVPFFPHFLSAVALFTILTLLPITLINADLLISKQHPPRPPDSLLPQFSSPRHCHWTSAPVPPDPSTTPTRLDARSGARIPSLRCV